jgi:hypothetical protein
MQGKEAGFLLKEDNFFVPPSLQKIFSKGKISYFKKKCSDEFG